MPGQPPVQSGRASAVGLCIESVFRQVPHTGAAIGVAAANPHRFFVAEPGGGFPVTPIKNIGRDEITGDREIHRVILTGKDYKGKDSLKVDPENMYSFLLGVFGRDVQTLAAGGGTTGNTAAYLHQFTPGKHLPSFTIEEIFGDGTSGRLSSGVQIQKVSLTFGDVITAAADYYGYRQIPNTYPDNNNTLTDYDFGATAGLLPYQMGGDGTITIARTAAPNYVDVPEGLDMNGPLTFADMTFGTVAGFAPTTAPAFAGSFMTVDGVAYAISPLKGWTLDFDNAIQQFMVGGGGYDPSACVANMFEASGKIDILFTDNLIPKAALKNATVALNCAFYGQPIGTSGKRYGLEVHLPRVKFLEGQTDRPATGIITGGKFVAEKDPVTGYSVKCSLLNTVDNTSLAGRDSTTPGGLGGWASS